MCLVACTALASGICYAIDFESIGSGIDPVRPDIEFALVDVTFWILMASAVFSFFYLGQLQRNRAMYAECLWFGVCMIPAIMFTFPLFIPFDIRFESSSIPNGRGGLALIVAAGIVSYLVAVLIPRGIIKLCIWIASCRAILIALSFIIGPANHVWLFAIIATGYTVYRSEWKATLRADEGSAHTENNSDLGFVPRQGSIVLSESVATFLRTIVILNMLAVGVSALVLASNGGPILDGAISAPFVALASLTIAGVGAVATVFASAALAVRGSRIDDAAATFVV